MAGDKVSPKKLSDLVTGGAPPDVSASFEQTLKEAEALEQGGGGGAQAAAAPKPGGWWGYGDPVERFMQGTVNPYIDASALPQWAKSGSRYVLPQNSVEAALMAIPMGGPLLGPAAKMGAKVGGKVIPQMIGRAGKQAVKSGVAAAGVGGLTGHDPATSGVLGAIGGAGGRVVGDLGEIGLQTTAVKRILETAGTKLKDFSAGVFKNIPAAADAKAALTNIITGNNAKKLEQDIQNLGQKYTTNPTGFDPRLHQEIMGWATIAQARAAQLGQDADKIFKFVVDPVTKLRIPTPQMQYLWKYGTPEVREGLIKQGWVLTQAGEAGAYTVLAKEAKNAQLIQHWLTGEVDPNKITPEMVKEVTERYFTPDMRLTAEGLSELGRRYAQFRPALERQLGKPAAQQLEQAIFHDVSQGLQRGVTGEPASVGFKFTPPFVDVKKPGVLSYVPGWEKEAGATLGEKAIQALTPPAAGVVAALPAKPAGRAEPPPPPAPVLEEKPPPTEQDLRVPGAADTGRETERPAVEPPPIRPAPPAGWFPPPEPEAAPTGETPWFNQPAAPMPTLSGEERKPGLSLDVSKTE